MRPIERIPIVLKHLPMKEFLMSLGIFKEEELDTILPTIDIEEVKLVWMENPDWRLTQVLVNMDLIPNVPGFWYYREEYTWLVESGHIEARDILLWTSVVDENMDPLPDPITKPISELETAHIEAILDGGFINDQTFIDTFNEELERRGKNVDLQPFKSCENCGLPEASVKLRAEGEIICDDCMKDLDYDNS